MAASNKAIAWAAATAVLAFVIGLTTHNALLAVAVGLVVGFSARWILPALSDQKPSMPLSSMSNSPAPPAGWYPDPSRTDGLLRYFDGQQWTDRSSTLSSTQA